ncbi:hypothetical protein ACFE04_000394 [Oxalis oulophora]
MLSLIAHLHGTSDKLAAKLGTSKGLQLQLLSDKNFFLGQFYENLRNLKSRRQPSPMLRSKNWRVLLATVRHHFVDMSSLVHRYSITCFLNVKVNISSCGVT